MINYSTDEHKARMWFLRVSRRSVCFILLLLLMSPFFIIYYFQPSFGKIRSEVVYYSRHYAEKYRVIQASWIPLMKPLGVIPPDYKVILLYTPYFSSMPWPQTKGKEKDFGGSSRKPACQKISSCYITYSRKDLARSDAVVFHARSHLMPWENEVKSLFARKRKEQRWVWFTEENPISTAEYPAKTYNNMMDYTVTYDHNSTLLSLYGYFVANLDKVRVKEAEKLLAKKRFSSGKDRLVLWFASNCVTPRLDVAREIAKYIHVDVFGKCQWYFGQSGKCGRWSSECHARAKHYKFYLAFENANCKGYVTEKYWKNALSRDIVPIVIAGNYNKDIMVPGSYIDILDFPNAKSLADYLKYLDSNDTAYNMYFQWKKKYTAFEGSSSNWLCDLCELLHKNDSGKTQALDLGKFWGVKENCLADDNYIENVWLNSQGSLWKLFFVLFLVIFIYTWRYHGTRKRREKTIENSKNDSY